MQKSAHSPILIYDVDGPLVNSRGHLIVVLELFRNKRFQFNEEVLKKTSPLEVIRMFESADTHKTFEYVKTINANFRELLPNRYYRFLFFGAMITRIRPYERKYSDFVPGVADSIRKLHAQGYLIGICSNSEGPRIQKWLEEKNLTNIIECFTSRNHRKIYGLKPSPGPLLGLLKMMKDHYHLGKIDKTQVAFVGDNTTDILAAQRANIKSIGVLTGHGYRSELEELNPTLVLESATEIPKHLSELFN